MASLIHLDTHVAIWLAAGELARFNPFVEPLLRQRGCAVCPMVQLEIDYLHELGRVQVHGADILMALEAAIGLVVDASPLQAIVVEAAKLTWTRDPFDRLICATARVAGASLLTKDRTILAAEPAAFWDQAPAHV